MKKTLICFLAILICIPFSGCNATVDSVINSLPKYDDSVFYSEGFIDYTDYAKYYYTDVSEEKLEKNKYFNKITASDIENITSYIIDFELWIEAARETDEKLELANRYDFSKDMIYEGNYIYIDTKEGEPIGSDGSQYEKFDNYSIYYFDLEKQILYYFHANI